MFISKCMTKEVLTIQQKDDILEANRLMRQYQFRHIPVILPDKTLIGIVSDRDIRSAMPSKYFTNQGQVDVNISVNSGVLVDDIMTKDPIYIKLSSTIHDALLLIEKTKVGAFPVVDDDLKVKGILSDRDLLHAFLNVLGIKEPGALVGIVVDENIEEMEHIIHALISENIHFGSILVYRNWLPGKRAVFPYLFAKNVIKLKKRLQNMGYEILDPMDWLAER